MEIIINCLHSLRRTIFKNQITNPSLIQQSHSMLEKKHIHIKPYYVKNCK
jgi:hypothetical protein